jgi:hypothetical protein
MFLGSLKFLVSMVILMMIFLEIGRRFRLAALVKKEIKTPSVISGPVETVVFAVLGLLIAFTFTGAGARFEARRTLVGEEATKIATAYLRVDLLSKEVQPQMRDLFKQYAVNRANIYKNITTATDLKARFDLGGDLQKQIWSTALKGCRGAKMPDHCEKLIIPALNEMFNASIIREVSLENHPPNSIYLLLIALGLFSALIIGYDLPLINRQRAIFYMFSYSVIIAVILYLIFEIELPNYGLINVSKTEHVISDLVKKM